MEIVSEPDCGAPRKPAPTSASCARSCAISAPATATWRRVAALRLQRLGAAARRADYGTRCEIKNVNSVRFVHAGDRVRGAPPGRADRGGRHGRAGDAAVRQRPRRDAADALARSTRTTTAISPIPTCCRSSSTPNGSTRLRAANCPSCPTPRRRASSPSTGCAPRTPACWSPSGRPPSISRRWRKQGATPKSAANWVMGDLFGALNQLRARHRATRRSRRGSSAR